MQQKNLNESDWGLEGGICERDERNAGWKKKEEETGRVKGT